MIVLDSLLRRKTMHNKREEAVRRFLFLSAWADSQFVTNLFGQ